MAIHLLNELVSCSSNSQQKEQFGYIDMPQLSRNRCHERNALLLKGATEFQALIGQKKKNGARIEMLWKLLFI